MQLAQSGYSNRRNPAGIVFSVALHAGLVAAALIGFGAVEMAPPPPAPIIAPNIPDPPAPPQRIEPRTIDQAVTVDVPRPIIEFADPPQADKTFEKAIVAVDPGPGLADGTAILGDAVEPVKPVGETRSARIDARYRADFQPSYPTASRRLGEEGTVVVRVVVGTDGRVVRASIARSSGSARLDEAALKRALVAWRFVPALRDGVPVEAERELPVTFLLRQG